jgi:hypothetical protein
MVAKHVRHGRRIGDQTLADRGLKNRALHGGQSVVGIVQQVRCHDARFGVVRNVTRGAEVELELLLGADRVRWTEGERHLDDQRQPREVDGRATRTRHLPRPDGQHQAEQASGAAGDDPPRVERPVDLNSLGLEAEGQEELGGRGAERSIGLVDRGDEDSVPTVRVHAVLGTASTTMT